MLFNGSFFCFCLNIYLRLSRFQLDDILHTWHQLRGAVIEPIQRAKEYPVAAFNRKQKHLVNYMNLNECIVYIIYIYGLIYT